MDENEQTDYTALTVQLLSAYLANNLVPSAELGSLIQTTRTALIGVQQPGLVPQYEPAVSVRRSLASRDHLISLIDGKPYKTLKRHLSKHGLTPESYRARYHLPADYPMVSAGYSEHRRDVATRLGLGRKRVMDEIITTTRRGRKPKAAALAQPVGDMVTAATPPAPAKPRGRKPKA